jgi:hypothetical protein
MSLTSGVNTTSFKSTNALAANVAACSFVARANSSILCAGEFDRYCKTHILQICCKIEHLQREAVHMGKLVFSPEVIEVLNRDRFHHPHPEVRRRMMVVWMCSQRRKQLDCAEIAGVSERTVRRYIEGFEKGGMDWLRDIRWKGHQSCLTPHAKTLEAEFQQNPPWTVARSRISN